MCNKTKSGFTLVEMMVVIAVISILSSMLLPTIYKARAKAKEAGIRAEIKDMERACQVFSSDFGFYPPDSFGSTPNEWYYGPYRRLEWAPLLLGCPARDNALLTPDDMSGPYYTTRCLVFFLGSEFTIGGKKFGPYYSFCRDQLDPHPDDPDWQGTRYPASGVAYCTSIGGDYRYGREGCRSYYCRIPWSIRGVCDDTDNDVRLFLYMDKFGPSRRGNLVYNNWYVYDCHFPEVWHTYGDPPQPPIHNVHFVDIYSHGFDGTTSVNVSVGGGGGEEEQEGDGGGDSDEGASGANMKTLRGMWRDDINNWTSENEKRMIFNW